MIRFIRFTAYNVSLKQVYIHRGKTYHMELLFILRKILIGVPIGFAFVKPIVLDTFGYIARVDGISMQPTLNPDSKTTDYVFLNHWSVRRYNINRGDVISFISPKSPDRLLIKRVIGLAGDVISTIGYKTAVCQVMYNIFTLL